MPLTPETGRRLFNDDRLRSLTTTSYSSSTTRRPVWGFNIARFMASISQCRSCYLDNSDKRRRRLRKPQNVDNDNWFAYKYLRSIQKTSDWLDDATYLRVQANCTTIQIDGAYDANSVSQRKLYKSLYDDEIHSATGRDEIWVMIVKWYQVTAILPDLGDLLTLGRDDRAREVCIHSI